MDTVVELQTLAVLMALFSQVISWSANCQPWQFWWHFSATTQSVHRTANLGSFYGTSQSILVSCQQTALCHIWLCSGWNVPLELPRSAVYWPNQYYGRNVPSELPRLVFADQEIAWPKCAISTAKVGSSVTKPLPWPKSAIRTAKVGSLLTKRYVVAKMCHYNCQGLQFFEVTIELLRVAVLIHKKKVWIELPRLAVLMALFRTANSGSCSQV